MRSANRARYADSLYCFDRALGKLLAALPALTSVVFVGDHGESLGDHGGIQVHGTNIYDEQIKVPLVIADRNWTPGPRMGIWSQLDVKKSVASLFGFTVGSAD